MQFLLATLGKLSHNGEKMTEIFAGEDKILSINLFKDGSPILISSLINAFFLILGTNNETVASYSVVAAEGYDLVASSSGNNVTINLKREKTETFLQGKHKIQILTQSAEAGFESNMQQIALDFIFNVKVLPVKEP